VLSPLRRVRNESVKEPIVRVPRDSDNPSAGESRSGLAKGSAGLLPPPALGERCHRGLVRRLVASARAYVGFVRANVAEHDLAEGVIPRVAGP
jgi:hypothetical protein